MKTNVHNKMEMKVLAKEWSEQGTNAGETVEFYTHSGDYLGKAIWENDFIGFKVIEG